MVCYQTQQTRSVLIVGGGIGGMAALDLAEAVQSAYVQRDPPLAHHGCWIKPSDR